MMTDNSSETPDGRPGGRIVLTVDFPGPVRWCVPVRVEIFPALSQGAWFIDADHLLAGRGQINARGDITIKHTA